MMLRRLTRACLVGLLVVAGCGGGGSKRLQGKWHGQRSEGVATAVATQSIRLSRSRTNPAATAYSRPWL